MQTLNAQFQSTDKFVSPIHDSWNRITSGFNLVSPTEPVRLPVVSCDMTPSMNNVSSRLPVSCEIVPPSNGLQESNSDAKPEFELDRNHSGSCEWNYADVRNDLHGGTELVRGELFSTQSRQYESQYYQHTG